MESLGEQLRKKREEKNLSLEELSCATRIGMKNLEAIENDDYDSSLPPAVYIKGFISAYCRQVGLDEKECLRIYGETHSTKKPDLVPRTQDLRKPAARSNRAIVLILLVLLLGALSYFFFTMVPSGSKPKIAPLRSRAVTTVPPPAPPQTPSSGESSTSPAVQAPSGNGQELPKQETLLANPPVAEPLSPPSDNQLRMKVDGEANTWVEVTIDGNAPFDLMLYRGNVVSWEAKERIELKIGNAGGININVNNVPLKPFGKSGEVVKLVFQGNTFSLNGREPQKLETWQENEDRQSTGD